MGPYGAGRYLRQPFAVDRIVTAEAQRYWQLAVEIMTLGQTIAESGPKALRCRFDLADRFDAMSAEIHDLAAKLEITLTGLSRGTGSVSRQTEEICALVSVESKAAPLDGVGKTRGGDP